MNQHIILIDIVLLFCSFSGCIHNKPGQTTGNVKLEDSLDFGYEVKVKYANKLLISNYANYKEVNILNPLGSDTIATYIFALHNTELTSEVESKGTIIRVPVKTIVCLSSTQVGALEVLDLRDRIIGVTNVTRFWDEKVNELIDKGHIKDVGKGMKADNELIVTLGPDILVRNDHTKNIEEKEMEVIGIHTVFYNDWRENNLLARAEWMKFMGILFCRNAEADSLFYEMESRYNEVKRLASKTGGMPDVFVAQDIKGTWFVPGSQSYIPAMIADAHAYTKAIEGVSTSMPCSFEKVYKDHHNDKYWLNLKGGMVSTLKDFGTASEHYSKFDAFKAGNVYINNKRVKPAGGNDFWESGPYRPDVILKDLIKIFHPELLPGYETYYWRRME